MAKNKVEDFMDKLTKKKDTLIEVDGVLYLKLSAVPQFFELSKKIKLTDLEKKKQ